MEKRKKEILIFTLMALLCLASFGLGYLAAGESERATIVIEKSGGSN